MDYIFKGFVEAISLLSSGHAETYSAIWVTLQVSSMSIIGSLVIGTPLGFLLGHTAFPGKAPLRVVVDTLLSFPTVVIGLLVYAFLTRRGPLGEFGLLFTLPGIAAGQIILGLPIVVAMTATAVENLDMRLKSTLLSMVVFPFRHKQAPGTLDLCTRQMLPCVTTAMLRAQPVLCPAAKGRYHS